MKEWSHKIFSRPSILQTMSYHFRFDNLVSDHHDAVSNDIGVFARPFFVIVQQPVSKLNTRDRFAAK
jgi:hypothetical protein